jgi:hypothetical protein
MSHLIDDIIVSEPGNINPKRLAIASPQLSWEINAPGSFSGFVRLDELRKAGLAGDIKGMWLTYPSTAGWWGGVVTGKPTSDGVAEIVAAGFSTLLSGHVITNPLVAITGSAGGLAKQAILHSGVNSPTFIRIGMIDEGGGPVSLELTGDVGNDLLPQIADAGDVEWRIDADRVFSLSRKLGRDRSAAIRLTEDVHIVSVRVADDLVNSAQGTAFRVQGALSQSLSAFTRPIAPTAIQPPTNPTLLPSTIPLTPVWWETVGTGMQATFAADVWESLPEGVPAGGSAPATARRHPERIVWQSYVIDPPGVASIPSSSSAPPPWVGRPPGVGANNPSIPSSRFAPQLTIPTELTLANIDGLFSVFDLGDTVRIELGSIGVCGRFRMKSKALDVVSQSLSVSGDLLKDA